MCTEHTRSEYDLLSLTTSASNRQHIGGEHWHDLIRLPRPVLTRLLLSNVIAHSGAIY